MIKNVDGKTEMIFGTGDIGFNPGVYEEGDKNIGVMIFYNQEPREIGFGNGDVKAGVTVDIRDFPVVLKFNKTDSIDVLIGALQEIKSIMVTKHDHIE